MENWKARTPKQNLLPPEVKHVLGLTEDASVRESLKLAIDALTKDHPSIRDIESNCLRLDILYGQHCKHATILAETYSRVLVGDALSVWRTLKALDLRKREIDVVAAAHENLSMFFADQTELFKAWAEDHPDPSLEILKRCEPYTILSQCVHPGMRTIESPAFLGMNLLG